MPVLTIRLDDIEKVGPVLQITLGPSVPYLTHFPAAHPPSAQVLAMVDTGASNTVVAEGILSQFNLPVLNYVRVNTPSSENLLYKQFDIQLLLPNNIRIPSIMITEAPLRGQHIQCLIGRDVLKYAQLIYSGVDHSFSLAF